MKYLYQNKHWKLNKEYNIDKLLYLMIDRPNKIDYDFIWRNNENQNHRDYDLPSLIHFAFNKKYINLYWQKNGNGKHYRLKDKPTIIYYNGEKIYKYK